MRSPHRPRNTNRSNRAVTLASALEDFTQAHITGDVAIFSNVGFDKLGFLAVTDELAAACVEVPETARSLVAVLQSLKQPLTQSFAESAEISVERAIEAVKALLSPITGQIDRDRILALGLLKAELTTFVIRHQIEAEGDPLGVLAPVSPSPRMRH